MASFRFLRSVQLQLQISKSSSALALGPPAHRCTSSLSNYRNRDSCTKKKSISQTSPCQVLSGSDLVTRRNYGSIHEPEYLDASGPEVPLYDLLNIQVKGYDFPVLEKFARYVHNTAERIGLTVDEAWATPAKKLRVTKLKPESTVLETEYALNLYERTVQLSNVPATLLPVFINVVEASIPAGVSLRIHPHLPEHTEIRYVPDLQLKELRSQLDTMRGGGGNK